MKNNNKILNNLLTLGAILILIGAGSYITNWILSPYLYSIGAILFAIAQILSRYEGKNLIIQRLRRQQILGAILLLLTGVCMFTFHNNEWIICLTIAALLELYTAFRIPQEIKNEKIN